MSVHLISRSFYTPLPAHLKLTLIALADEANDDGTSICVGQRKLATKCGVSERSVRDHLKDLVAHGLIRRLDGKHPLYATDQYEIAVDKLGERPPATSSGDRPDRKPSVLSTGSPLPPTQLLTPTPLRGVDRLTAEEVAGRFGEFWKVYPRREARAAAFRAFVKALRRAPFEEILAGALKYRDHRKRDPEFTAHPATWLNADRWADEYDVDRPDGAALEPTDWDAYYREQDAIIERLRRDEDGAA